MILGDLSTKKLEMAEIIFFIAVQKDGVLMIFECGVGARKGAGSIDESAVCHRRGSPLRRRFEPFPGGDAGRDVQSFLSVGWIEMGGKVQWAYGLINHQKHWAGQAM